MRVDHISISAVVLVLGLALPSSAQIATEPQAAAIEGAVAAYLRPREQGKAIAIDIRVGLNRNQMEARPSVRNTALAAALGGSAVLGDTIYICRTRRPSDCTLKNVQTLFAFGVPRVTGGSATVDVRRFDLTTFRRQPVARMEVRFTLSLQNGAWSVIRMEVMSQT